MKSIRLVAMTLLIVGTSAAALLALGQRAAGVTRTEQRATAETGRGRDAHRRETVTEAANVPIPNLPGKRLVSRIIDYPPGVSSVPHRHAQSAFIYAYVLSGLIRSQVDDGPARIYRPGETWFESPGAHHRVSENASGTEPARLLAVLVVDAADVPLTIPDAQ